MARQKKEGPFITIKIKQELADSLETYSERTHLSKTAIIELALAAYLANDTINLRV